MGFQRPLASMNDSRARKSARKQIISTRIFLGVTGWTILNSIKLITYYLVIRFLWRLSLVQSVTRRRIRAKLICLRVDLLPLGVIHACEWDNWCPPELLLRWRSRVIVNRCKEEKSNNKHCEKASFLDWRKLPVQYPQTVSESPGKCDNGKKLIEGQAAAPLHLHPAKVIPRAFLTWPTTRVTLWRLLHESE